MSASLADTAVYVTDTPKQVKTKVNKYAYSGGRQTVEEHRRLGGDPDVDVAFQWISFFEEDDEKVEALREGYRRGEILSGEMKAEVIALLNGMIQGYQERKAQIDDDTVRRFMTPRKLEG